ncbi:MAG: hypothetical protein HRU38_23475 [Saccharospirillaceae bacterium]|nr:hypothetical protein [Saccharospirillaceae bacterium]
MVFVEALVIGLPALIVSRLFMNEMISGGVFESASQFWERMFTIATLVFIPPFVVFGFKAFPDDVQDDIKIVGVSLMNLMVWAGYGVFFAAGASLYWYL